MGIRIHKVMGWGILLGKRDFRAIREHLWENDLSDSVGALMESALGCMPESDRQRMHLRLEIKFDTDHAKLEQCVRLVEHPFESERGVAVFVPPQYASRRWYRYDDDIDYAQEMSRNIKDPMQDSVVWLRGGPYPYIASWMHEDGTPREHEACMLDLYPDAIPSVPIALRILAEHVGLDWRLLRPVLVQWWA